MKISKITDFLQKNYRFFTEKLQIVYRKNADFLQKKLCRFFTENVRFL